MDDGVLTKCSGECDMVDVPPQLLAAGILKAKFCRKCLLIEVQMEHPMKFIKQEISIRNFPVCTHDAAGRCIHPTPWDMDDGRRELSGEGWVCRACHRLAITENQAQSKFVHDIVMGR